ncbi:MAG: alpha/beta hydrolase [Flavobacterium sp.]|uniref:alpha/beta hydrolase family protein n=1 Tax=Flavobacterium sp. TaxID=239 RepID=UPI001221F2BB|nr:alpha/beta hydrolase [Flavobacterium sp.]RZJ65296.1 MAG: alpha/beta hydrolase [Flavobacterium sp.]
MKKIVLFLLISVSGFGQNPAFKTEETAVNSLLTGTLYTPEKAKKPALLILLSGSGPTDRDGNQPSAKTNCLKLLAESVATAGTAVYSFDKRIVAEIKSGKIDEAKMSFENYINDAKDVIAFFKASKKYSKIIVGGHSEGSLVGMVAANGNADAFISLAGAGRSIDKVITEQVIKQNPEIKDTLESFFVKLKQGKTFKLEDQMYASLFRESVQPYMISWIKYDPSVEIKKLKIPTLIVNGTTDIQVPVLDAEILKQAKPDAKLAIIENMNHIFKIITGDRTENLASYNKPELPISSELSTVVNQFIKTL